MFRKKFQFLHSNKHVACGCATVRLDLKNQLRSWTRGGIRAERYGFRNIISPETVPFWFKFIYKGVYIEFVFCYCGNNMTGFMATSPQNEYVPLSIFADRRLTLAPEDYPNGTWSEQHGFYNRYWAYYKGYVLNQKKGDVSVYPVKLNITRSAVINHAAVMLGQFSEDRIVQFGVMDSQGVKQEAKEKVIKAANMLWSINNGDNLLLEQSLFYQIFGGYFWKVAWTPTRKKWPIRYFTADPRACFPVWDGEDYDRLIAIDVIHQVPRPTAEARFRVDLKPSAHLSQLPMQPEFVTVHEHWDENEYWIKVDEQIGKWPDGSEMAGANPFLDPVLGVSVIPWVYVPRLRAGEFYGDSLIPSLIGPQDEINNNLAHIGEGLADAMHQQPWVRNRPKGTQGLDKRSRSEFINLGMPQHGADSPEVGRLEGAEINQSIIDYVTEDLVSLTREHNNMPDVAYGRTDASIRSALTLKYMMWPALNTGLRYRKTASTGFKWLTYTAFVIANSKRNLSANQNGVSSLGVDAVTPDMIEAVLLAHKTSWPPMLPDDRAELVNEIVQRLAADIISPETAIRRLDGADELEEELNRIDEHRQKMNEIAQQQLEDQARVNAKYNDKPAPKSAEDKAKDKKSQPKDRTNKAQAEGGRKKEVK